MWHKQEQVMSNQAERLADEKENRERSEEKAKKNC